MLTTKKAALRRARILRRALEGCDRAFFLGLAPALTGEDDNAYTFESGGVTLTIRFDADGRGGRLEPECRYRSSRTEGTLTIPDDTRRYPDRGREYGYAHYRYSVDAVDRIMGRGRCFLRHLTGTGLLRLGRSLRDDMRCQDRMLRRGTVSRSEYDRVRRCTELAALYTRVPAKEALGSMDAVVRLFNFV